MWSKGSIEIDGTKVQYWVKYFDEGSEFGIDGGKISKLECRVDGKTILNYDRGWDMKPETELAQQAYAILIDEFN